jgi:hypothetical protein
VYPVECGGFDKIRCSEYVFSSGIGVKMDTLTPSFSLAGVGSIYTRVEGSTNIKLNNVNLFILHGGTYIGFDVLSVVPNHG